MSKGIWACNRNKTTDLTEGSPLKLIVGFMLPLLFGLLFQQLYTVIDTVIVGQYLGINALAGIGSTSAVNFLVFGFIQGMCVGFGIPIAQQFGAKNFELMRRYIGNVIWLAGAFASILTVTTAVFCREILIAMSTPSELFQDAYSYIFAIFLGIPVTYFYNILAGVLRSVGDSKTPVYFLVVSNLLNMGLDVLLIFVFGLGVVGAGLATVISQLASAVLCLVYVIRHFEILHLNRRELHLDKKCLAVLCGSGIPMGLQYSITAIGSILIQSAVNGLGAVYVAAVTASTKLHKLLTCPFDALGSTMATYGGQNVGAGKLSRIKIGLASCLFLGFVWALICLSIVGLVGKDIIHLFVNDTNSIEEVLILGQQFLIVTAAFYIPLAAVNIIRFLIQGMGYSQVALFAGVFETVARGIVALGFVPVWGYDAVCFAHPAAWILADSFLIPLFFICFSRLKKGGANV